MSTRDRDAGGTGRGALPADSPSPDRPGGSRDTPQTHGGRNALRRRAVTTILFLASAAILSSVLVIVHGSIGRLDTPAPPYPPRWRGSETRDPLDACELRQRAERQWRAFRERLVRQELRETEAAIRNGLDTAFAPVYTAIPAFTDWHYSVIGQYVELGQAVFGKRQEESSARLFAGLQARVADASTNVDRAMSDEMRRSVEQWVRNEGQTLPTESLRTTYQRMLDASAADAVERFSVSAAPSGVVAAGTGAIGMAAATALTAGLTKRLAASATVRAAGKAARIGSPWGTTLAGAAAGAVLGPVGAAISGVLAGAVAWLALDSAFVNIDEHLNRSAFERDLIGLVNESKAQVGTALSAAVAETRAEALRGLGSPRITACAEGVEVTAPGSLDGRTPSELSALPAQRRGRLRPDPTLAVTTAAPRRRD